MPTYITIIIMQAPASGAYWNASHSVPETLNIGFLF